MKLSLLIQCGAALEAIKNLPIGTVPIEQWIQASNAHCAVIIELAKILTDQAIEVTA